ncbi:hypothetical protein DPMN_054581 [Dreissena polymorpha]|uniref:VWF/SSPO/Zonadhesin-like cysteine-rich domain-containing protein n=1 Tax=Dreissena polymorpha TaxID=45954 RepID=A0A9D4HPW4_DREPO|nr:hypothetical protein DPMN_054581 [Dreissena polymorpha]
MAVCADFVREKAAELLDDCVFDACEDVVNDRDPSRLRRGSFCHGHHTSRLFELDNGKPCHMTVFIKNKITSKGTASVAKEMYIYLFGSEIVIRSDENKKVRINDEDISLAEEIDMHGFTVMDDGKYVVVKNNFCGLSAGYDGAGKGFVSLPAVFGLDPTVPPDPDAEQCARAVTEKASTECEVIRKPDGPLGECVKKLANETTQALFDENVREREADDIVCASAALLAELCNQNGEMPEWRTETFCPGR